MSVNVSNLNAPDSALAGTECGMTKQEVADLFKVSTKTVERNSKNGFLPAPVYIGPRTPRWNRQLVYELYCKGAE